MISIVIIYSNQSRASLTGYTPLISAATAETSDPAVVALLLDHIKEQVSERSHGGFTLRDMVNTPMRPRSRKWRFIYGVSKLLYRLKLSKSSVIKAPSIHRSTKTFSCRCFCASRTVVKVVPSLQNSGTGGGGGG